LAQTLGRHSVEVSLRGIFYGPNAIDELDLLRGAYLGHAPVDFFTESVGEGYFAQVLISRLDVSQRAGYLDQFDFICEVVEHVEPPEPVAADPFALPDTGLLGEAASFMNDVQNGLEQVSQLVDLLNVPDFADPVKELPQLANEYEQLVGEGLAPLAELRNLLWGSPG
jgi:hypothetical protein